jgi:SAM-dependent methyltransferase
MEYPQRHLPSQCTITRTAAIRARSGPDAGDGDPLTMSDQAMHDEEAFLTLHRDMPRQGPGSPEDVRWALRVAGTRNDARVADAGCGPGADLVALAEALPEARIEGFDQLAHLVDEARAATAPFGARVTVELADMRDLHGPYDLIWCAGALYFLGVASGLSAWARALATDGRIAFSHPVLEEDDPPEVAAFWAGEPEVGPRARTEAAIASAGYRVLGYRRIDGEAWTNYYEPMEARIRTLRAGDPTPALSAALDAGEAEIAAWRAAAAHIAYGLWVVAR